MKILFIGARLFDDIALYAKKERITSVLTESNPDSKNLELADIQYVVPRGMEKPKEIALKEDVDAVVPLIGIDKPLIEVSMLKEDLENNYGIPVVASPLDTVITAGDKLKTKEFFIKNEIKTPDFNKFSKNHSKIDLPVVLKKFEGQGGSGVKIALTPSDLEECIPYFEESFAEKFVEGFEISIEVLRWNNKTVPLVPVCKGKTTLDCTHPLDKLKTAPLNIESVNNEYIKETAKNIADLLGSQGVIDIDIIFDEKEEISYFIEINTRPSGTRYLTAASSDINPLNELVDMATGKWKSKNVLKRLKEYYALEIPMGDYKTDKNNYKFRNFHDENCFVIHGPEKFQRITIRSTSMQKAFDTANKLNIDYKKFY
ncbi:MAG: ATP-grasp domain-containing protein [Methanobacterium sp.]|uniref:ATP-grasp domain-containing protein n=1 Tax=Methanobacterium sp. TaxID=2164 RepID=UPI003D653125|nr:ATP-grasp domain-containing protein [Methanobacterium sp.]